MQLRVTQVVRTKGQVGCALNHWVVRRVKIHRRVVQVSASELRTTHGDLALAAVSDEDGGLDGANEELTVLAAVNSQLS